MENLVEKAKSFIRTSKVRRSHGTDERLMEEIRLVVAYMRAEISGRQVKEALELRPTANVQNIVSGIITAALRRGLINIVEVAHARKA